MALWPFGGEHRLDCVAGSEGGGSGRGRASCFLSSPRIAATAVAVRSVEVEGTAFRVTLSDGRVLPQDQLPGTILMLGDGGGRQRRIRIDGVERDRQDATGEIVLYAFSEQDPESGEWRNLCLPAPDGRRLGFPLAGAFTSDGRYEPTRGEFSSPAPEAPRACAALPTYPNPDFGRPCANVCAGNSPWRILLVAAPSRKGRLMAAPTSFHEHRAAPIRPPPL